MVATPSLDNKIQAFLASESKTGANSIDYLLVDHNDGNGAQIAAWNETKLGPQPTSDQLTAVAAAALVIATAASNIVLSVSVDMFRDARLATGFADTGQGGTGKTYACDNVSITKWTAQASLAQPFALGIAPGGLTPPTFQPIPTDNSIPSPMSAGAVYALFAGRVMPWVSATLIYGRTMKNNILAGNPPADITQGWP